MVDYCEKVLVTIRSADAEAMAGLVRESIVRFLHLRGQVDASRYVINMIATLHSANTEAVEDRSRLLQAIELFKRYQVGDLDILIRKDKPSE